MMRFNAGRGERADGDLWRWGCLVVLYKRLVLGEPQRRLRPDERMDITKGAVVVQHPHEQERA